MFKFTEKIIKAKWKGLRDNFRIQWKMIPRDDNDCLLVPAEEFTGTKWYEKSQKCP
jgi:CTP synthase